MKAIIQNIECDTDKDIMIMPFMSGTLYTTNDQYYLYCESVRLNGCVYWGKFGEYVGDLPTVKDVSEDMIENFDEHTRKMIPLLGDEPFIPRRITKSITLLPLEDIPGLFIDEIKKSKVDIGDSIVIMKDDARLAFEDDIYTLNQWKFEGSTYSVNLHNNSFFKRSDDIIKISDDEYWIKVNPGDQVLRKRTDGRGYPPSCGVENREKDVIMIVKCPAPKPEIGQVRDLSLVE